MSEHLLASPRTPPPLTIPDSTSTVDVRIIDPTGYGKAFGNALFTPQIPGLETITIPSYAFLISHSTGKTAKHILFDAGIRKDWQAALPSEYVAFIEQRMPCKVDKDIDEILSEDAGELGITPNQISAVIWSHHHFDHRGNITKFPPTTDLIWGPGSTAAYSPKDTRSSLLAEELEGRTVRELDEGAFTLNIGGFAAHDFFEDGSFYVLSAPGHTIGHLCALARVTAGAAGTSNPTFVFTGSDTCHHAGIFRPSAYLPLPAQIPPAPHSRFGSAPCPGAMFLEHFHPEKNPARPFFKTCQGVNVDQERAEESIRAMQAFDADENVLVCIAHDMALGSSGLVDFYPGRLNDWKAKALKRDLRWWFCGDFDRSGLREWEPQVER